MLPLAELVVAGIVAGPRLVDDYQLARFFEDPANARALLPLRSFSLPPLEAPPRQSLMRKVADAFPDRTQCVVLANIPGAMTDLAVIAVRHRPTVSHSRTFGFDRWAWAAILYPLFALPFWWVLGRSMDASRSMKSAQPRRVRWWDLLLMLPVACGGIAGWVVYQVATTPAEKADPDFRWLSVALGIWGVAAAGATVIWFQQWRRADLARARHRVQPP